MALPIACTLTAEQLRERRETLLASLRNSATTVHALSDGYAYSFAPDTETLLALARLVDLERQCCQFLTFKLIIEPLQPFRLEVTGPNEARSIIADYFGDEISN